MTIILLITIYGIGVVTGMYAASQLEKSIDNNINNNNKPQKDKPLRTFPPLLTNDIADLDKRIYKESQSTTGGEFSNWHSKLTSEERESYQRIYGH